MRTSGENGIANEAIVLHLLVWTTRRRKKEKLFGHLGISWFGTSWCFLHHWAFCSSWKHFWIWRVCCYKGPI